MPIELDWTPDSKDPDHCMTNVHGLMSTIEKVRMVRRYFLYWDKVHRIKLMNLPFSHGVFLKVFTGHTAEEFCPFVQPANRDGEPWTYDPEKDLNRYGEWLYYVLDECVDIILTEELDYKGPWATVMY
jgi:hypothetical protein